MPAILEKAKSGRAKCRGCGERLSRGEIRFGEVVDNPFGDGETTYWFHPSCAAFRRPEAYLELEGEADPAWVSVAEVGRDHHRLARIQGVEASPSGRARCRHCQELIEKGATRIVLTIWEEGRFSPMGFIHAGCAVDYFGTQETLELRLQALNSDPAQIRAAIALLSGS